MCAFCVTFGLVRALALDADPKLPVTLKFTLDASAASIIAAVLDEIGTTENIPDRSGQLEWLCQDWRDGGRTEPETIEATA